MSRNKRLFICSKARSGRIIVRTKICSPILCWQTPHRRSASLEQLEELSVGYSAKANALAGRLRKRSSQLEAEAAENEPPEPDYDHESEDRGRDEVVIFDIGKLFSEL